LKKQHRKHSKKTSAPCQRFSKANLDELAADMERGIQDLPVWKEWVQRFGLAVARKFLRRGLVINQLTDGNPDN
jgi:hypothetical protein